MNKFKIFLWFSVMASAPKVPEVLAAMPALPNAAHVQGMTDFIAAFAQPQQTMVQEGHTMDNLIRTLFEKAVGLSHQGVDTTQTLVILGYDLPISDRLEPIGSKMSGYLQAMDIAELHDLPESLSSRVKMKVQGKPLHIKVANLNEVRGIFRPTSFASIGVAETPNVRYLVLDTDFLKANDENLDRILATFNIGLQALYSKTHLSVPILEDAMKQELLTDPEHAGTLAQLIQMIRLSQIAGSWERSQGPGVVAELYKLFESRPSDYAENTFGQIVLDLLDYMNDGKMFPEDILIAPTISS